MTITEALEILKDTQKIVQQLELRVSDINIVTNLIRGRIGASYLVGDCDAIDRHIKAIVEHTKKIKDNLGEII
jgi:hypothetical protein